MFEFSTYTLFDQLVERGFQWNDEETNLKFAERHKVWRQPRGAILKQSTTSIYLTHAVVRRQALICNERSKHGTQLKMQPLKWTMNGI